MNHPLHPRDNPDHQKKMTEAFIEKHARTLKERFWRRVKITNDINDCWEWHKGAPGKPPWYPMVSCRSVHKNGPVPVHRLAFYFHFGYFPEKSHHVCHKCNNKACCNPHHLYDGTAKTNHEDAVRSGTFKPLKPKYGEDVPSSKLTVESVILIRKVWPLIGDRDKATLAKLCGVTVAQCRRVSAGKMWSHVD